LKSLELFSGAGGLAKGLTSAGFEHVAFIEINKHACMSLRSNFDANRVFEGDIRAFPLSGVSNIDIVAGGPPCQPFSLGGKHEANDDKRDMFPSATGVIEKVAPKAFLFENVKGLLRDSFSTYFQYVILRLTYPDRKIRNDEDWQHHFQELQAINFDKYEGLKYQVSYQLVDAADYGVPQCRERVVIVGIRADLKVVWKFPKPTHSEKTLLWDKFGSGEYWDRHQISVVEREPADESVRRLVRPVGLFDAPLPWLTIRDVFSGIPDPQGTHGILDHQYRGGARSYPGHTGSDIDAPAKTIKAGVHGVPGGENMVRYRDGSVRYFTVYEAKRLQTFPPDFVIHGAWGEALRQIGNAVPVTMAEKFGRALFDCIGSTDRI
jgi:DNA (cytosine-5)-methyltransferase 1